MKRPAPLSPGGFSLVELLVVMAVLGVLVVIATPALHSISQGNSVTRAGQDLADSLILSHDEAITRNRKVTIRFIKKTDSNGGGLRYRAIQAWVIKDDAGNLAPLTRVISFPAAVVVAESPTLSPLIQAPPAQAGTMTISGVPCDYVAFTILANGSLDSTISNQSSFLTLVQERDVSTTSPVNFFSIFLSPITGEVSTFRP